MYVRLEDFYSFATVILYYAVVYFHPLPSSISSIVNKTEYSMCNIIYMKVTHNRHLLMKKRGSSPRDRDEGDMSKINQPKICTLHTYKVR